MHERSKMMLKHDCSSSVISRRFGRNGFAAMLIWLIIGYTTGQEVCYGEEDYIECESENYEYKECPIDESRAVITSAKVIEQHSKSECDFYNGSLPQNYNGSGKFGFTESILWVHRGCYAKFEICLGVTDGSTTIKLRSSSPFSTSLVSILLTHSSVSQTGTTEKAQHDDVPVAAIVAPILSVAMLVVSLLLFILWRKGKLGKPMESTELKIVQYEAEGKTSINSGVQAGQSCSEEHYYTDIEQQTPKKAAVPTTNSVSFDKQWLRQQKRNSFDEEKRKFDGQGYISGEPEYSNDGIGATDVIIQTLPDEEYNVIGIEPNKMVKDNNYDTLKNDRGPGYGEYSHTSEFK